MPAIRKPKRAMDKDALRNLTQFRRMSEEEFERYWQEHQQDARRSEVFERRISAKIAEFSRDYDLDDMKVNDHYVLRALVQAILTLEDYEQELYRIRQTDDYNPQDIMTLGKIMSDLRRDISTLQDDLNITRKKRTGDKASVVEFLDSLKRKAKRFYDQTHTLVFCPKCNMLIGTVWSLYPNEKNKIVFVCGRKLENGERCGQRVVVNLGEIMEVGSNVPEIVPEGL